MSYRRSCPITREILDSVQCSDPNCPGHRDGLVEIAPSCHPAAGLVSVYSQQDGTLLLYCKGCGNPVEWLQIAAAIQPTVN